MADVLTISGMRIVNARTGAALVDGIDLTIARGELVGLVGESGSGKTTVGLAGLGYVRGGMRIDGGEISLNGQPLLSLDSRQLSALRRSAVAYVPQSAAMALNPALRVGTQLAHRLEDTATDAQARLLAVLDQVRLPATAEFLKRYPHQLSGGQQQRVAIAAALLADPALIVFDEPTTGLDVAVQAQILELIRSVCEAKKVAGLFISHDLAAVAALCRRTVVLRRGRIVESGTTRQVLKTPSSVYGRKLIDAVPSLSRILAKARDEARSQSTPLQTERAPRLSVTALRGYYGKREVLHEIDLTVPAGGCLALVGESGSGKTTLCRALIGLHENYAGTIAMDGVTLERAAHRRSRGQRRDLQYVFQNPYESLNPRCTVGDLLLQPLRFFGMEIPSGHVREQLARVSLGAGVASKYPHQLSGGERQRVALARALAVQPKVMICDEVTSALDVSVQASVVDLINDLRRELQLTVVFVTHHIALVPQIADQVAVLAEGRVVEQGETSAVFGHPRAALTRSLIEQTLDLDQVI
ncbi:ABC transporter ATP-binding protein [Paraburkholderia terrae]